MIFIFDFRPGLEWDADSLDWILGRYVDYGYGVVGPMRLEGRVGELVYRYLIMVGGGGVLVRRRLRGVLRRKFDGLVGDGGGSVVIRRLDFGEGVSCGVG